MINSSVIETATSILSHQYCQVIHTSILLSNTHILIPVRVALVNVAHSSGSVVHAVSAMRSNIIK